MTVLKCCPKNLSEEAVVRNVRTEMLEEKASEKTTPFQNDRTAKAAQKGIRKNCRSKNPYQKASWKSIRENIL